MVESANEEEVTLEETAQIYAEEETGNYSYPTYMDVYNSFYEDGKVNFVSF